MSLSRGACGSVLILGGREGGRKADLGFFVLFVLTPTELRKTQHGSEINLQLNLQAGREILTKQTCDLNAVRMAAYWHSGAGDTIWPKEH